jgi:putative glutamine amidotransferase
MTNKKIIGIYVDSIGGVMKQTTPYINFILNFGVPILITQYDNSEDIVNACDALLIPGGSDVNPMRYGEIPHPKTGRSNAQYEYLDSIMIPAFINAKKPIIGICRGFQSLNVHFGGTLKQHIEGHYQTEDKKTPRNETKHRLIQMASNGENIGEFKINSIHHQVIDRIGNKLIPIGFSPKDSSSKTTKHYECYVEAFKHSLLPIVAFQYHPEEFNCPFAIQEINKILN